MKRFGIVFLAITILFCAIAYGADITLNWDGSPEAISYKIQMSTDDGATWSQERSTPADPNIVEDISFVWTSAPNTGLLLFRIISSNSIGDAPNTMSGAWYCGDWKLPRMPMKISAY